jgi:adenine/guanine phosphoribosyltransferase-like PRPP-binding protein
MTEADKIALDWLAGGATLGALVGMIPQITAVVTLIYVVSRLWEGPTVRRLLRAICARCAAWWDR